MKIENARILKDEELQVLNKIKVQIVLWDTFK